MCMTEKQVQVVVATLVNWSSVAEWCKVSKFKPTDVGFGFYTIHEFTPCPTDTLVVNGKLARREFYYCFPKSTSDAVLDSFKTTFAN